MTDKFAMMQRSKISKKDWKRQNFVNMVSLYQHELIKEGLEEIWGTKTGFSYSSGFSLEELLNFIPPVETKVTPAPIAQEEEVEKPGFDSLGNLNYSDIGMNNSNNGMGFNYSENSYPEYDYDAYSSSESLGPLTSNDGSPKNSMYSGPHDVSFLNKYARFLVPGSFVCTVQFKYACRDYSITEYLMSTQTIDIGSVLVVRSHVDIRQIDMGVVVRLFTVEEYKEYKSYIGKSMEPDENFVGQVLRVAFKKDTKKLTLKHTTEATLLPICQNLVTVHQLPILVYGIEFQYDGFNLFVYYTRRTAGMINSDASEKLDFKAYIYDLIIDCPHTRIIMKDTTNCRPFAPDPIAEKKLKKL